MRYFCARVMEGRARSLLRIFSDVTPEASNQRPDTLLRNLKGFGRQATLDVAVAAVDGQSRARDDAAGFHFASAVFSHTGQFHESIKRLIAV